MSKPILGTCHICGIEGRLSFEHVPPRAAFNQRPLLHTAFDQVLASEDLDSLPYKRKQKGAGAYTLCGKCNNDTGSWYGAAYADWAHQAMRYLIGSRGRPSLAYPFNLFPLRILKQIICMFFSFDGLIFQKQQPDLVRFLLDKETKIFPKDIRIYAFYTLSDRSRAAGMTSMLQGFGMPHSTIHLFSEIAFPPLGFVLTHASTPPPTNGFCDISDFSKFDYCDWRCNVTMKLPLMPIYTAFPGDYRPREQVILEATQSRQRELEFKANFRSSIL